MKTPIDTLRHHVTGAIERGQAQPIVEIPAAGKLAIWAPRLPDYPDSESRDAYRAGYSDGYHCYPHDHGDWPVQPYSKGYWEGVADRA